MPTFTEITIEDLRRVKSDPLNIYRNLLAMDFGAIVPNADETVESIRTGMLKMAMALGVKVEFYLDGNNPDVVVYEVVGRNMAREITVSLPETNGHVEPVTVEQTREMATQPTDTIGFPEPDVMSRPTVLPTATQEPLPAFAPPIETAPEPTQTVATEAPKTEPTKVRVRRSKAQIAADEAAKAAAKTQPQVAPVSAPEPVAAGTVFEGVATVEHPLVTAEKVAGLPAGRKCPGCGTTYAMAKICPQCGQMTEAIAA